MFLSAKCSLSRDEGFSYGLDRTPLYRGLDQKDIIFFSCKFFSNLVNLNPGPRLDQDPDRYSA
jgi:hypothetical protein